MTRLDDYDSPVAAGRRLRFLASLCACGMDDSACIVESQVDGDCSAHDARIAAKPTGYWGVGTDGERAWEVGERYEQHSYSEDDEDERGRMAVSP